MRGEGTGQPRRSFLGDRKVRCLSKPLSSSASAGAAAAAAVITTSAAGLTSSQAQQDARAWWLAAIQTSGIMYSKTVQQTAQYEP